METIVKLVDGATHLMPGPEKSTLGGESVVNAILELSTLVRSHFKTYTHMHMVSCTHTLIQIHIHTRTRAHIYVYTHHTKLTRTNTLADENAHSRVDVGVLYSHGCHVQVLVSEVPGLDASLATASELDDGVVVQFPTTGASAGVVSNVRIIPHRRHSQAVHRGCQP